MDTILSFYEKIAEAIYKTKTPLMGLGFILSFIGLFFDGTKNEALGISLVLIGILSMGTRVFCLMFAPIEQTLLHGEYVFISKVRDSALVKTFFVIVFFTMWYIFMVYMRFNVAKKTLGQ